MKNVRLGNDLRIYFTVHKESGMEDLTTAEDINVRVISTCCDALELPSLFSLKDESTIDILVKGEDLVEGEYRVVVSYYKYCEGRDPEVEPFELDDGLFRVVKYSSEVGGVASSPYVKQQQMRLIGVVARNIDGANGVTPHIGSNGNWYIGESDTGVQAQLVGMYNSDETMEQLLAYGIQYDASDSTFNCVRIGSSSLHVTLPIQSKLRGCLLDDDGEVVEYLPADDWSNSTLDGSMGQVMVEMPEYYCKFVKQGTLRQVWMSEQPLAGYHKIPKAYYGAYEATIKHSENKLSSVVNSSTDYRGGDNNASNDSTLKTGLGKGATNFTIGEFRTSARNRKEGSFEWNIDLYSLRRSIFWLAAVEYAKINLQANFNSTLTSSGYRQGGLGQGVTTANAAFWGSLLSGLPVVACGVTNSLGNYSGESSSVINYSAAFGDSVAVNRYRGVEIPFGHYGKFVDGINVYCTPSSSSDSGSVEFAVYLCDEPSKFSDEVGDGYEYAALLPGESDYIADISFGEFGDIVPVSTSLDGSSSDYYGDSFTVGSSSSEASMVVNYGGNAVSGADAGLVSFNSAMLATGTSMSVGTRLTFVPAN